MSDKDVVRKAETLLAQTDFDGKGAMSFDEFTATAKKFPNLVFPSYILGDDSSGKGGGVAASRAPLNIGGSAVITNPLAMSSLSSPTAQGAKAGKAAVKPMAAAMVAEGAASDTDAEMAVPGQM